MVLPRWDCDLSGSLTLVQRSMEYSLESQDRNLRMGDGSWETDYVLPAPEQSVS